ncbi:MAG: hypothetical protein GC129_02525 [Proteobacteria bacterium]|nr:hypothetical protein [Pseudomonadota bacterium]
MKSDLSTVVAPFPNGLMSTARSALTMPSTFAREVRNMLMGSDGAGSKRNGVVRVGDALDGEAIVAVTGFMASGGYQLLVVSDAGKIYRQDGDGWEEIYSGLDPSGAVRTVSFAGKLLLCNGVDDVLAYDGASWSVVATMVTDVAAGLAYVGAAQFSIESDEVFYPVGSTVRATLDSGEVTALVSAVSTSAGVVTVTLDAGVLDSTLSAVAFTVKPPRVAYLAVAHDRLWGFGTGAPSRVMSGDVDRLRVYYTFGVNDHTAWPDTETGVVPSINLADKAGVADELMAMAVKDNITVFLGRHQMQLWTGSVPDAEGDFAWSKTIPLGVMHRDAVLELPNDLLFFTRGGARTLSRTVQTEQLDVSDVGAELDPTVTELVAAVMADDELYRRVVPMHHDVQGWLGVAMSDRTLVWQVGAFGKGWVVFDGAFAGVSGAHTAPSGVLYLAKGGQLYAYDETVWSDDGEAVQTRWWLPWLSPGKGKRWAGKYVELLVAPGSKPTLTVRRYRDYDEANPAVMSLLPPSVPDLWDTSEWEEGLWDSSETVLPVARDHVVAEALAYAVESGSTDGPLTLFGLKLYGVAEQ